MSGEVVLTSATPDPVMLGQTLVVTGTGMDYLQALYIDGVSVPWVPVSTTEVHVLIGAPYNGLREIYAEFV